MYFNYKKYSPQIGKKCFIAPSAQIIGRAHLADHVSVWFGCVIRGDVGPISIGKNTNIQDLSMLHITENIPLFIGDNVTIGHRVVLHSCTIEDSCLIGMGSIILDNVVVGKNSLVAAGSVLPPGKIYPPGSMIMGSPARVIRVLTDQEKKQYGNHYKSYVKIKDDYLEDMSMRSEIQK